MYKEIYLLIWYFVILIPVSFTFYSALMAIDFSKIFKSNSTWQIRALSLLISLAIGFAISDGIFGLIRSVLEKI